MKRHQISSATRPIMIASLLFFASWPRQHAHAEDPATAAGSVSATVLLKEFAADEVAADRKYKDQTLIISGTVARSKFDPSPKPENPSLSSVSFSLAGATQQQHVVFVVIPGSQDLAAKLAPGQSVKVKAQIESAAVTPLTVFVFCTFKELL